MNFKNGKKKKEKLECESFYRKTFIYVVLGNFHKKIWEQNCSYFSCPTAADPGTRYYFIKTIQRK